MIKPTVGRIVLYAPNQRYNSDAGFGEGRLASIITKVHDDRMVNLAVFTPDGEIVRRCRVPLEHGDRPVPTEGGYCEWMEYQKGQANKTDALMRVLTEQIEGLRGEIGLLKARIPADQGI